VKRHAAVAGGLVNVQDVFDLRVGQAVGLIQLLDLLHGGEQLLLVQRLTRFDQDFFFSFESLSFLLPSSLMSVTRGRTCTM